MPSLLLALLACSPSSDDVPWDTDPDGVADDTPGDDSDLPSDTDGDTDILGVEGSDALAPGPHVVRRLSVRELRHALADLVGVEVATDVAFPTDVRVAGFDQHGEAGPVSDLLVEQLDRAAEEAGEAWAARAFPAVERSAVASWDGLHGCAVPALGRDDDMWAVWVADPLVRSFTAPAAGTYVVQLEARYRHAEWGSEDGHLVLRVDGTQVTADDLYQDDRVRTLRGVVNLTAGPHEVQVHYVGGLPSEDDFFYPGGTEHLPLCYLASGLAYGDLEVRGPAASRGADAVDVLGDVVAALASRAWRRPVAAAERTRLRTVVAEVLAHTDDVGFALASAAQAVFLSPHFLLVLDTTEGGTAPYPLDAHSLAARLALALWSSVPDDALRACAEAGTLTQLDAAGCGLLDQVERMVADARFLRTVEAFARQWLDLDAVAASTPPVAGEAGTLLLADMADETVALVTAHLDDPGARPLDLLTAPRSWPSAALAAHEGLVRDGDGAVDVAAAGRAGLLGQASLHVMGASGTLSSPVRRGIQVLDKLVCDPPDPPPQNVPGLPDERPTPSDIVEQLAQHRANPSCAQCHDRIDPPGLALEGFGADGRQRTPPVFELEIEGHPITSYDDLVDWLRTRPDTEACMASWLATHQTGRTVTPEELQATGWLDGRSWQALLARILATQAFTHRTRPGVAP
ncbi:MAG: DUF1588 domain-containing protein [Alphaproteobacteria bacterium]|nr:DUF1588 domain-containing protein [Alphaproteobacteria bacterium]